MLQCGIDSAGLCTGVSKLLSFRQENQKHENSSLFDIVANHYNVVT